MNLTNLLGKLTSSFSVVRYSKLHCSSMERDKIQAIMLKEENSDKK